MQHSRAIRRRSGELTS